MTWLGPDEPWATHPRPEAQKALREVRELGWSFRPASGHAFGTIKCPYPHHPNGGCTLPIASTSGPLDGSVTANEIRYAERRCARHGDTDPALAIAGLLVELRQVDEVLKGAERLSDSESLEARAEKVLAAAEDSDEASEGGALNEAIDLEGKAQAANTEALVAASRFGLEDPWPPDAGAIELAQAARERLDEAIDGFSGELSDEAQGLIQDLEERLQGLGS